MKDQAALETTESNGASPGLVERADECPGSEETMPLAHAGSAAALARHLAEMGVAILAALEPTSVWAGHEDRAAERARLARQELNNLMPGVRVPAVGNGTASARPEPLPGAYWSDLDRVLERVSQPEAWLEGDDLVIWLRQVVLVGLDWALDMIPVEMVTPPAGEPAVAGAKPLCVSNDDAVLTTAA